MPDSNSDSRNGLRDEAHYRLREILAERPNASQRELAPVTGFSLGKLNYCVRALLERDWVKASNAKNSKHKLAYLYLLNPGGLKAKARITARFLKRKRMEFETLKAEIAQLTAEVDSTKGSAADTQD